MMLPQRTEIDWLSFFLCVPALIVMRKVKIAAVNYDFK